jgi:uncharacterized protein (TIGR02757 family)
LTNQEQLYQLLEQKFWQYNQADFIANDPITIPHLFTKKQDIEIMGLWAAVLAWGQRVTIINNCKKIIDYMDGVPYQFIMQHEPTDLRVFEGFVHRTFNATDALYFIHFFRKYYSKNTSLEQAFLPEKDALTIEKGLVGFKKLFFDDDFAPARTQKHISSPLQHSACKRLNMFLRWMVRTDSRGVDFGLWQQIKPSQLVAPCDVHVQRVAQTLGLLKRTQNDWPAAIELTTNLRRFDPTDPVKYDFALFGMGVEGFL